MQKGTFLKIAIPFIFFFWCNLSRAQTCLNDYFAITYASSNNISLSHSVRTTTNDIVCTGNIDSVASGVFFSDGWLAKFTANGTLLWSKRYAFPGYNFTAFRDLVQVSDDSYWVVGEAYDTLGSGHRLTRLTGVLLHIDTYGNLIQSQAFDNSFRPLELTQFDGISKMKDGDFIIRGSILLTGSVFVKLLMLRIDANGNVKWTTRISSPNNSFAVGLSSSLFQENNKIVLGSFVIERDISTYQILKEGYFLASLDYGTGQLLWNKTYNYFNGQSGAFVSSGGIVHISSPGDDRLSFQTSFSDSTPYQQPPYTRRSVNIITDASGNLLKAVAYYNTKPGCTTADVYDDGDSQVLLMDDGTNALLIKAGKEGTIQWQNGYRNLSGNPVPGQLIRTAEGGYFFFMNDRYNPRAIHLLKTNVQNSIECAKDSVNMVVEDATHSLNVYESQIYPTYSDGIVYTLPGLPVYKNDYVLSSVTDCIKPCCKNVIDTASTIILCDVASYTLPNNDVVKESGTYYTAYKTTAGCDSVSFLPVWFLKKPVIMLSSEECIENKDSIVIEATGNFSSYNWMNQATTDSVYTAKQPGIYWVEVSNSCGTIRDSVEILEKCNYEIYIPNAFTPNGDGVNDNFGISHFNKNHLIQLKIFNRWGKSIFETSDINKRWDGSYHKEQQATGVYLYYVEMEDLAGKRIKRRGTVALIR